MLKAFPVYRILDFHHKDPGNHFYANHLHIHLRDHQFTNHPHKHDFYLTVLFTKGRGTHEVDFINYDVKPGVVFALRPGQMHSWNLSRDTRGYVFFHSKDFYEERYTNEKLNSYPFFASFNNTRFIQLDKSTLDQVERSMGEIVKEYKAMKLRSDQKIHSLVNIIYIELMRVYSPIRKIQNQTYLSQVQKFEDLIEENYRTLKLPKDYASKLNISEKHLNRITRSSLNKTSSQLIAERIILEAKRLLFNSPSTITEISEVLGFNDASYFIRFFKKHVRETPLAFSRRHR
jgi:AraC family transcriptional regulator, transcriptional activator of pobA